MAADFGQPLHDGPPLDSNGVRSFEVCSTDFTTAPAWDTHTKVRNQHMLIQDWTRPGHATCSISQKSGCHVDK